MKFICPHCNQHLESEEDLSLMLVQCPSCHKSFLMTPSLMMERTDEYELDAANNWLKRAIGCILYAIWGVVKRIYHVIRWIVLRFYDLTNWLWRKFCDIVRFFFSFRFLKFLILLMTLGIVVVAFAAIVVAPFYLWIWFAQGTLWLNGAGVADGVYMCAWVVEILWLVLFVAWGAWKGVKSYKYGVIARWRERWRIRREERRARKAAQRADKETVKQ